MKETHRNRYLDHLRIDPPDIEALVNARPGKSPLPVRARPFELLACAILEAGRPLSWEEAAARLTRAGLRPNKGSLDKVLRGSWRGKRPVVKGPGETIDLDLHAAALERIVQQLGLRATPPELHVVGAEDEDDDEHESEEEPIDDGQRLTLEELELAFGDADLDALSGARQAAAVLDAMGADAMAAAEVETVLEGLTRKRDRLSETSPQAWAASPATLREDGVVVLDRRHRGLRATRRLVRTWARAARDFQRDEAEGEEMLKAHLEDSLRKWERDHAITRGLQRSVLHVVPTPETPEAAALLEFPPGGGDERLRIFLPGQLDALRAALSEQDAVAGVDPRASFHALEVDPHRPFLIDLVPENWTPRAEPGHRVARLTRRSLLAAATGSEALSHGATKALLRKADRKLLAARLRLDVWALASLYRLGVLFPGIPLYCRERPILVDCRWALPGERMLPALLDVAAREGRELEFRDRSSWRDPSPWARARPGRLVSVAPGCLFLQGRRGFFEIEAETIGDVRFAETR